MWCTPPGGEPMYYSPVAAISICIDKPKFDYIPIELCICVKS